MRAMFELTEGLRRLQAILVTFPEDSSHWSEAQNRFQFVDRLLTECLGWEKPDIEVEAFDDFGGRSDYLLGHPYKAVLEAKREAASFGDMPTGNPGILRKIGPLIRTSRAFDSAVKQVVTYCALKGAQIAIICNGPQLAVFQAVIPGMSPLEGECYFFNGFSSYVEHFPVLWKILSPEGISENRAYRDLALHRNPRIPQKASTAIAEPTKFRYRNSFQENLRALSSLLLEEIEDNPELKSSFYRECYVPSEANNRHLLLSKSIIAARYKRVETSSTLPAPLDKVAVLDNNGDLRITEPSLMAGTSGSRPIVVIGDVGVGKTSFFENLFENLNVKEKAETYFISINLGAKASLSANLKDYILSEIPAILKKNYSVDIFETEFVNSIYYEEIAAFDRTPAGKLKGVDQKYYDLERFDFVAQKMEIQDQHLHASLGHLARGRGKQIILVIDNADQRSFDIQQEAFLIAQELAASRNLLVFISLRPSTFYLSKARGALSGYQNKILTISPPPADEVVQRRLTFAVRVAEGKVRPTVLTGVRLQIGSVVSFLNATLRAIRTNDSIKRFLSNITGGNTRAVIELITSFCGSPNVDSQKIVRLEEQSGGYKVPLHEFAKHALLGEYAYFNSQSSLVACNIFDVSAADPREHFLASLIITYLSSNIGVRDNDGFINGVMIVAELCRHGFIEDQVRYSLRRLAEKRLIETPHAHFREVAVDDSENADQFHFRATSVGIYHVRYWTGEFAFMDAVAIDTPIFDEDARGHVMKLASSFDIADRFERTNVFQNYLEAQWYAANISANYYDFSELIKANSDSLDRVKSVSEKGGGPLFRPH